MKKENVHAKHKKSLAERFWKQKYLFLLLLPSLVWVILICYAPMTGLYMSFINYTPQGSGYFADMANSQFVGLDWFKYFFSTDFTKIMRNTLATSLLTLLFSFPLPIILALCLNEVRNQKAKKFVQTASYIPYFISWVIAANIFLTFLSSDGVINNLLKFLGLTDESILFSRKDHISGGSSRLQMRGRYLDTMRLSIWRQSPASARICMKQRMWMVRRECRRFCISHFRH